VQADQSQDLVVTGKSLEGFRWGGELDVNASHRLAAQTKIGRGELVISA
jgi:hypothetical protein